MSHGWQFAGGLPGWAADVQACLQPHASPGGPSQDTGTPRPAASAPSTVIVRFVSKGASGTLLHTGKAFQDDSCCTLPAPLVSQFSSSKKDAAFSRSRGTCLREACSSGAQQPHRPCVHPVHPFLSGRRPAAQQHPGGSARGGVPSPGRGSTQPICPYPQAACCGAGASAQHSQWQAHLSH